MSWVLLIAAGLFEIGWAIGLRFTDGFNRPLPSLFVFASMATSMFLLSLAVRSIPVGTAYAVWVGIGVAGVVIFGAIWWKEPITAARGVLLALLIISIMGLRLVSPE